MLCRRKWLRHSNWTFDETLTSDVNVCNRQTDRQTDRRDDSALLRRWTGNVYRTQLTRNSLSCCCGQATKHFMIHRLPAATCRCRNLSWQKVLSRVPASRQETNSYHWRQDTHVRYQPTNVRGQWLQANKMSNWLYNRPVCLMYINCTLKLKR